MAKADKITTFQSQLLYIALACFACVFLLKSDTAKELFGSIYLIVKQANAVIMWLTAILSGKQLLDLLDRFKKVSEDVKKHDSE